MKNLIAIVAGLFCLCVGAADQPSGIDYDQVIHLDAEDLAESGMKEGYTKVLPTLKRHIKMPASIKEISDSNAPSYSVVSSGTRYEIYAPETPEIRSWGNATYAFFTIVNRQLGNSAHRFYAINAGNDLAGVFLTESQVKAAKAALKKKTDWPYIPTNEHPWYGQYH